jgi:hypothetical protein
MMNSSEMGEILAMVSAIDGQLVRESKIAMWLEVLDGCSYEELRAAIVPAHLEAENGVVQPRDLWMQVKRARAVANAQVHELEDLRVEDDSKYVGPPSNLVEMQEFYQRLWEVNPWEFEEQNGDRVLRNGKPHMIPLTGEKLKRSIFDKAWEMGWSIPEARWDHAEGVLM